jgi:hypothetical protein
LKHAKKPTKPKSHKSKKRLVEEVVPEEPEEEMFDQVIMTTEPEPIEVSELRLLYTDASFLLKEKSVP